MASASVENASRSGRFAGVTASRRELLIAGLCLVGLQLLIGYGYVRHGGFVFDDWIHAAVAKFYGFGTVVSTNVADDPRRPLGAVYFAATNTILGDNQRAQLAWLALTHVAFALVLYAVLRKLDLGFASAVAVAALVLLFPFSDSLWLWATMGPLNLAATLWLCGVLASLYGIEAERRAAAWHVCALACYVASVLLYELTLPLILVSGALLLFRAPRARALRWWGIDVAIMGVTALLVTSRAVDLIHGQDFHQSNQGIGGSLHHAAHMGYDGMKLVGRALVPVGFVPWFAVLAVAALLVAVAIAAAKREGDSERAAALRRWLVVAAGGAIVTPLGWLMLVPNDDYYEPLAPATGNRVNVLAAAGIAILVVALVRLAATLLSGRLGRRARPAASVLTVGLLVAIAAGYLNRVGSDRGVWERATRQRAATVAQIRRTVGRPRPNTAMIVPGFGLSAAPGLPVFSRDWDLSSAVQLAFNDPRIGAWPAPPRDIVCGPSGVSVKTISPPGVTAPYGRHLMLVDVSMHRSARVESRGRCRALARSA